MNHLFVPYQESLNLRELGFEKECLALYTHNNENYKAGSFFLHHPHPFTIEELIPIEADIRKSLVYILAPLYQQAFEWFREKHGYIHTICRVYNWNKEIPEYEGFCIYIGSKNPKVKLKCNDHFISNFYQDYKEAELVVLKTLIQIVKNDNTTRS